MPLVRALLGRREPVADETMAFFFERPEGFHFTPGQTVDLTLIDPPESDFEGDTRTFSIASAPYEPEMTSFSLLVSRKRMCESKSSRDTPDGRDPADWLAADCQGVSRGRIRVDPFIA